MFLSLQKEYENITLDKTKVTHIKSFFKLSEELNFNKLVFFLDRLEHHMLCLDHGKVKLEKFSDFSEGKEFCNLVSSLLENKGFQTIDACIFSSLTKSGISINHADKESVFLFNVFGSVIYNIYEERSHTSFLLNPGDFLLVPKSVVHAAIPLEPRIVVSVGVFD